MCRDLLFVLLLLLLEWCGWCVVFVDGDVVVGGITPPTTNNTTNNITSTNNQHQHPQTFVTILAQLVPSDIAALALFVCCSPRSLLALMTKKSEIITDVDAVPRPVGLVEPTSVCQQGRPPGVGSVTSAGSSTSEKAPDSPWDDWTPVFQGRLGSASSVEALDLGKLSLVGSKKKRLTASSFNGVDPVWPFVFCSTVGCAHIDKWNRMISIKVMLHIQETFSDSPDQHRWKYKCVLCVMREEKMTDGEAKTFIYEKSGAFEYKKRRVERFETQMKETMDYMTVLHGGDDENPATTPSRHCAYQLSRQFLQAVFFELSEFIVLKAKQMDMIGKSTKEAKKYFDELKTCSDPFRVKELMTIIEKTVITDIPQLSFGGSQAHLNASAYDDQFASFRGGHFRFFFVCLAGWAKKCMTLISSKKWRQLYPDQPWASGQRWYCRCYSRYKSTYGVIVEIRKGTSYYYMRADCPDSEILDIRAMAHEKKYGKLTPAELYAALPICQPAVTTLVTHDESGQWAHFESFEIFETLPQFGWDTIFQLAASM
jgi:hypothetical protein